MLLGDLKTYYDTIYLGEPIPDEEFPRLQARAEDVLMAATFGGLSGHPRHLCGPIKDAVLRAACAQVEYIYVNGLEAGGDESGMSAFTTGHVSVSGGNGNTNTSTNGLCKRATIFLMPTGLMYSGGVMV